MYLIFFMFSLTYFTLLYNVQSGQKLGDKGKDLCLTQLLSSQKWLINSLLLAALDGIAESMGEK